MKNLTLKFTVILVVLFLTGCMSSKKALRHGDYYKATILAVKTLQKKPNNKKAQEVIVQSYPLAKTKGLHKIQNALDANYTNKYAIMADEYLLLNNLADAIYSSPKALELIPNPTYYSKELREVLPLAAEEAYQLGEEQLSQNTIQSARKAYFNFIKADKYQPNYREVKDRIEEALYLATLKVVVRKPITPIKYQLTADFFYNNLMASISKSIGRWQFVRFYTYEEAENENLKNPDQYLILDFNDFSVGNMVESKNSFQVVRDSVLVGTTTIGGLKRNVYGQVKADFIGYRREVISQGILSARIINATNGRIEEHRRFPGKYVWINEWATYRGDERALSDEQIEMTNTEPIMPPPQQDLFVEFTQPIFNNTVSFLRRYYYRYK